MVTDNCPRNKNEISRPKQKAHGGRRRSVLCDCVRRNGSDRVDSYDEGPLHSDVMWTTRGVAGAMLDPEIN